MDLFTSAQERGHEGAELNGYQNAIYDGTNLKIQQQPQATSDNATIPSSAVTATFNTTELLEQVLSYLPAPQLLTSKATCHSFRDAIEASPILRRKTSTFLRLGDADEENDLFKTDAGGEAVFPIEGLGVLAFFYPGDGERRVFVRFEVGDEERFFERVGKAGVGGFGGLVVVDQALSDVRVGRTTVTSAPKRTPKTSMATSNATTSLSATSFAVLMRPGHATTVAAQIFNTPELLDLILSNLRLKDILSRANSTCRGFRNMVHISSSIEGILAMTKLLTTSLYTTSRTRYSQTITADRKSPGDRLLYLNFEPPEPSSA
ncbi:hypothetical protein Q7P35_007248 [Cladosporium inversicolor]